MKCKKTITYLLSFILILLFSGCTSSKTPVPYKKSYEWSLQIDNNLTVNINDKSNLKIYIDNTYDIDRKDKVFDFLYKNIVDKNIILTDDPRIVDKNKNIETVGGNYVKIDTKYTYDPCLICMFNEKKLFIGKDNIKRTDNGLLIDNIEDKSLITSLYSSKEINKLQEIQGIDAKFHLDIKALEKGIAHFTDKYLLKYSLKEYLKKELELQGFNIVDSREKADIIIVTENLGFSMIKDLIKQINYPRSYNMTYGDLFKKLNTNQYYKEPLKTLHFSSVPWTATDDLKKYTHTKVHGNPPTGRAGGAVAVLGIISLLHVEFTPISTVNFVSVFNKTKKIGKVIDISIIKDDDRMVETYFRPLKYSNVLSDELIDELNQQAAKQILKKIKFIEE